MAPVRRNATPLPADPDRSNAAKPIRKAKKSDAERQALDELIDRAAKLWAEGKSRSQIAAAIGMTDTTLKGVMQRDRGRFPARSKRATAAIARVRRGGERARAAVGSGKAAGSSKVDEAPVSVDTAPVSAPIATDPVDVSASGAGGGEAASIDADDQPAREDAFRPLAGFEPVTLVDAASSTCRWPIYPAGRSRFGVALHCCGRATGDLKRSYCDTHTRMSRGAGSASERAAHKLPGRSVIAAGGGKPFFAEAVR